MNNLKRGDKVLFIKPYRDSVQAGEVLEIDRALYLEEKLISVYLKTDTTYIYFDGNDFFDYCKAYEVMPVKVKFNHNEEEMKDLKDLECKLVDEFLKNVDKKIAEKWNRTGSEYKAECDRIDREHISKLIAEKQKAMREEELALCMKAEVKPYDYINPNHYKDGGMEVIDMMVKIWGVEKVIAHCEITAFKYRMRAGKKPDQPIERDLQKAKWYENKAKELKDGKN